MRILKRKKLQAYIVELREQQLAYNPFSDDEAERNIWKGLALKIARHEAELRASK